ncbi:Sugar transporter subunit: periplasmic-binding component of ABC superfamily domain protein [Operophtera brumata]|uniref:Sugar transporter subunit: periplasmic-binding component of ABC superfamily domain protein n=1 Tax=Operophtera brumata TaxID=104452 RepID=A0A0L7LV71_OPEBR|nr:Sugar transporter subunit: periplasmic-binding component of ABC superfamily domain protein [Operophtera brumata]
MVMESGQNQGRFWPLSPRLWRRSNEYSKVVFEPRKPPLSPIEFRRKDRIDATPDLLRSRSFIKDRLDHLNLEEVGFENRWSVAKPPIKEKEKKEEVVKLRVKKQRQARPNSLQLLLCPSSSGHYSKNRKRKDVNQLIRGIKNKKSLTNKEKAIPNNVSTSLIRK